MVKLKGPCFSLAASGTIGGVLCYQKINGLHVAKALKFIKVEATPGRIHDRIWFKWAFDVWLSLAIEKKNAWKAWTDSQNLTGWKAFSSQFQRRTWLTLWQFELPPSTGFCIVGNHNTGDFKTGGGFLEPPVYP
jgi:hypothetical protein